MCTTVVVMPSVKLVDVLDAASEVFGISEVWGTVVVCKVAVVRVGCATEVELSSEVDVDGSCTDVVAWLSWLEAGPGLVVVGWVGWAAVVDSGCDSDVEAYSVVVICCEVAVGVVLAIIVAICEVEGVWTCDVEPAWLVSVDVLAVDEVDEGAELA
eukprot:GDKJ01011090.1.p2 GENE.GDKJ01011090.1~~GDKJ01011090.1.p2  ORF type:complete len:156 (+),score=6.63 GDKJ01011090.1:475-942(+)